MNGGNTKGEAKSKPRAGFSLVEVMVATAILMVVVLMVGSIFTSASSAWESGYSRAEGGAAIRSVSGAISRDLETAVDMRDFFPGETRPIKATSSSVELVAIKANDRTPGSAQTDSDSGSPRDYVHVTYSVSGSKVTREESQLVRSTGNKPEWKDGKKTKAVIWDKSKKTDGAASGASFEAGFKMEPLTVKRDDLANRPYNSNSRQDDLEDYGEAGWAANSGDTVVGVRLRMELKPSGSFSSLRVTSYGRDGLPNDESKTKDDIVAF